MEPSMCSMLNVGSNKGRTGSNTFLVGSTRGWNEDLKLLVGGAGGPYSSGGEVVEGAALEESLGVGGDLALVAAALLAADLSELFGSRPLDDKTDCFECLP